jgi:hypothetical protein
MIVGTLSGSAAVLDGLGLAPNDGTVEA